ncbi:AAA family ATPase, partial [Ruminococcus callidus]
MYFEKITVKGEGKTDSVIEFRQGVNIVQGRSNTGKTAIIRCIDFALGSKKLPIDESFGYNEVELTIATPKGQVIINRLFHKGQVTVTTTIPDAENGVYDLKKTKNNKHPILSDLLLNTMGINTPCEVIQNADFKKQKLYIRTFLGMLMYIHTEIGREISIIEPVESTAKTPFLSALLLLLNDENLSGAQTQTKLEIRVARKKAVEDYINKRISATAKKRNDLEDQMKLFEG